MGQSREVARRLRRSIAPTRSTKSRRAAIKGTVTPFEFTPENEWQFDHSGKDSYGCDNIAFALVSSNDLGTLA
jgi:hypothetical protein